MLGRLKQALSSPRAGVLRANPWLVPFDAALTAVFVFPGGAPEANVAAARRAAAFTRLQAGADAWNAWAAAMQALAPPCAADPVTQRLWDYAATTDFQDAAVAASVPDLAGLVFPGVLDLRRATFSQDAWFSASTVVGDALFGGACFSRDAFFERTQFGGLAQFDGACFERSAQFRQARFRCKASFYDTRFGRDAWFRGASFERELDMTGASFVGEAGFGDVRYGGPTDFSGVRFGDHAGFEAAVFDSEACFRAARFEGNGRFEDASFSSEPAFGRARFLGRIIFDRVKVPAGASPVHRTIAELARRLVPRFRSS